MLDPQLVASTPRLVRGVLGAARRYDTVVLNGSLRGEQLAAALVARRRHCRVILADCTWDARGGRLDRTLTRAGVRAIDRGDVTYCVLSSAERELFPRTWGVERSRVVFTPWCHVLSDTQLELPVADGGYAFAGGDSMRDYRPLLEASRGLGMPVRIAARRSLASSSTEIPANVTVESTTEDGFIELMAGARVVVVPLAERDDRSAGQGTYLNAMALGKPVIVPDVIGVRDYIDDRETGLIVAPGDSDGMRTALGWVSAPENRHAVAEIAARAREVARDRFGPERYVESLLGAVDAARTEGAAQSSAG